MSNILEILVLVCACAGLIICRPEQHGGDPRYGSQDPEIWMDAMEIIHRWNYTAESHNVTTGDGYILNMQRIPFGKGEEGQNCIRPVVFFQHGLECSSANWITNLPNESAAYIFADAGFDVWLGNFRGNTYGKNHVNLTINDAEFWKFSWDEMAAYDLPTMINYVLNATNQRQLYYVGHSEGTMTAFAEFSQNQQLASKGPSTNKTEFGQWKLSMSEVDKKYRTKENPLFHVDSRMSPLNLSDCRHGQIPFYLCSVPYVVPHITQLIKHYYALAPIASVKHLTSYVLRFFAKFTGVLNFVFSIAGFGEFIPNSWLMDELAKYVCWGFTSPMCENIMFLIAGADSHQLNQTRIPVYVSHTPAGTSTQNIIHFGQQVNSGLFDKYDYGKSGNQQHYGTDRPPVYDLTQMKVATSLYWGDMDALADPQDVSNSLIPYLPNLKSNVELGGFNHLDFIWGLHAADQIYHPIVNDITRMEKDNMKCL